jgi:Ca2+/H+ antiporter
VEEAVEEAEVEEAVVGLVVVGLVVAPEEVEALEEVVAAVDLCWSLLGSPRKLL